MKTLINKKTRGFSLVELMVVVAIMGTLAAIAIPAYNEYRKSAKKAAYKSDLNSLHKGWLAFGVELDSFCERETSPEVASIGNVGMRSLVSSKLYGVKGLCEDPSTLGCAANACVGISQTNCVSHSVMGTACNCDWNASAGEGPGKHNFIGFGANNTASTETCTGVSAWNIGEARILGEQGGTLTGPDTACTIGITSYEMGVFGHFGGTEYYGVSIDDNGVLSSESVVTTATPADSGC